MPAAKPFSVADTAFDPWNGWISEGLLQDLFSFSLRQCGCSQCFQPQPALIAKKDAAV